VQGERGQLHWGGALERRIVPSAEKSTYVAIQTEKEAAAGQGGQDESTGQQKVDDFRRARIWSASLEWEQGGPPRGEGGKAFSLTIPGETAFCVIA